MRCPPEASLTYVNQAQLTAIRTCHSALKTVEKLHPSTLEDDRWYMRQTRKCVQNTLSNHFLEGPRYCSLLEPFQVHE